MEAVVQDVAEEAIEASRTDAVVEWGLWDILARATVVAGIGGAVTLSGILALRTSEGRGAQTFRALVTRNACTAIFAVEVPTSMSVILAG